MAPDSERKQRREDLLAELQHLTIPVDLTEDDLQTLRNALPVFQAEVGHLLKRQGKPLDTAPLLSLLSVMQERLRCRKLRALGAGYGLAPSDDQT